jgi:hypothetical protein
VIEIDDAVVAMLASEDKESSAERVRCEEKLKILKDGLNALQSVQEYPLALKGMQSLIQYTREYMY